MLQRHFVLVVWNIFAMHLKATFSDFSSDEAGGSSVNSFPSQLVTNRYF